MHTLLSRNGSDRATGYHVSSKLIRKGDTLYVGWLDAPFGPGQPAQILLGVCDATTGELWQSMLTMDAAGKPLASELLADSDATVAQWLPALQQWDWTRSGACCAEGLWMAYTRGLYAGGI